MTGPISSTSWARPRPHTTVAGLEVTEGQTVPTGATIAIIEAA